MSIDVLHQPYAVSDSPLTSFRIKRARYIRTLIDDIHAEKGACSIIDIGGTEAYWQAVDRNFLLSRNAHITLVNRERHPPAKNSDLFTVIRGDGCSLRYDDGSFDLAHSNSVIEHVGDWNRKTDFAREIRRLARRYYIQTPNYWFPWEPHMEAPFLHWLPEPIQLWAASRWKLGSYERADGIDQAMHILSDASLLCPQTMRHLFPDAAIIHERFCGLTKSLIAIRS